MFWQLFTVGRGDGDFVKFPTERTITEDKPLIRVSGDVAMTFNVSTLFQSILRQGEECLATGSLKEGFYRHRAKVTEDQVAEGFRKIIGNEFKIHRNLFETNDSQREPDIVIVSDHLCLIVEVKSSPPVEPRRDPDQAYERLRQAFRSDRGIQSAYDQAVSLVRLIEGNETVVMYDQKGNKELCLSNGLMDKTSAS